MAKLMIQYININEQIHQFSGKHVERPHKIIE